MKNLRKTIRKILLENQSHYEKLVRLLLSGSLENILQAVELADAMGWITDLDYDESHAHYFPQIIHTWNFSASEELMDEISYRIKKGHGGTLSYGGFSVTSENHRDVRIRLYVDEKRGPE